MTLQQALSSEINVARNPYAAYIMDSLNLELRLKRIAKRQQDSASMFTRLQVIIDQIEENFRPQMHCLESTANEINTVTNSSHQIAAAAKDADGFVADHNYATSSTSSGVSSASSSPSLHDEHKFNRSSALLELNKNPSAKRKIIDDEEYHDEFSSSQQQQKETTALNSPYPMQAGDAIILGPNQTNIDFKAFQSMVWSSAAAATRQLLSYVFSCDVLATHTLTGKPSPAFYGRERPAKMQLDPHKAADIIHCVKSKFNCTEREIRAAITTKCSDTSKKFKRRHQKQQQLQQLKAN